jgi:hypothetical protein
MADRWGVVEFSTANLKKLHYLPTYADAYRALRELTNANAALVSPMAWNGSNGIFVGQPGYVPYTSWRNTPAEDAAFDLLAERAGLPSAAKLWTFGSGVHADTDGWSAEGATVDAGRGRLTLVSPGETLFLHSPEPLYVRPDRFDRVIVALSDANGVAAIGVQGRIDGSARWVPLADVAPLSSLQSTAAGLSIPIALPAGAIVDRLRLEIRRARSDRPIVVEHVALYPRAAKH